MRRVSSPTAGIPLQLIMNFLFRSYTKKCLEIAITFEFLEIPLAGFYFYFFLLFFSAAELIKKKRGDSRRTRSTQDDTQHFSPPPTSSAGVNPAAGWIVHVIPSRCIYLPIFFCRWCCCCSLFTYFYLSIKSPPPS